MLSRDWKEKEFARGEGRLSEDCSGGEGESEGEVLCSESGER